MTSPVPETAAPKVIIAISDLEYGGAQRQVVELANNMDSERFELHVVSLHDYVPLAKSLNDAESRLHIVKRRSKFDISVVTRLTRLCRHLGASALHGYLFDAEIATRLAGGVLGLAVIGSERNSNYRLKPINRVAYRLTRRWIDLTIANSRSGADFNSKLLGQRRSSYRVVHNGVDTVRFQPGDGSVIRRELGIATTDQVIGMFASFKAQKNHSFLLRAGSSVCRQFPNARLLFVGDELLMGMSGSVSYKKEVNDLVDALGLRDRCIFAGNRGDVERLYRACDLTVLPSKFEGTPNVALESMASGIPIVATNVSDNAYVIPDGRVGCLVALDDTDSLAARICQILESDELRRRMGAAARDWILAEFTGRRLAAKTADVYEEAIRRKQMG
jgi:glycosyltransferase involved in cell wall biosynthesis